MGEHWLAKIVSNLQKTSVDYREKALLEAAVQLYFEQEQRIEQLEGQLDGTLWSPKNW